MACAVRLAVVLMAPLVKHVEQRVTRDDNGRVLATESHEWSEDPTAYERHAAIEFEPKRAADPLPERAGVSLEELVGADFARQLNPPPATLDDSQMRLDDDLVTFMRQRSPSQALEEGSQGRGKRLSPALMNLSYQIAARADRRNRPGIEIKQPEIELKTYVSEFKATNAGELTATFSTFGVVDHDGDVTLASAIPDGTEVVLGAYNHASVSGKELPIGIGVIRNDGKAARIVAQIFDTAHAEEQYATIKALGAKAEYSYAFKVLDFSTDRAELKAYGPDAHRILKQLDVIEVSSVIRGAGLRTGTDRAKTSSPGGVQLSELGFDPAAVAAMSAPVRLTDLGIDLSTLRSTGTVRLTDLMAAAHDDTSRFMRI